ncbi:RNA-guided endonuclease InsQ/TnpB family protein [Scytonema sp. PCC 10023]|uniref:RNA-guided endonuclease InsQ/TnpB family protein n=1 Tax=Scytonema sp. PCC 10023 TaxID=1680591 RepID=UPI0039C701A8
MRLAYQYRFLPTTKQKLTINKWLEMLRLQYNYLLQQRFDWYEQNRCSINACPLICHLPDLKDNPDYYSQKRKLVQLKEERPWYSEIYSHVLQDMVKRVDLAFSRYIKGDCNGKRSGKPRFKGKGRYRSFTFDDAKNHYLKGNKLYLSKIGWVKIIFHRPIPNGFAIKTITISKKADGVYATLSLEDKSVPDSLTPDEAPSMDNSVGVDMGVLVMWASSDGDIEHPKKHFRKSQNELRLVQRRKDKRRKGSRPRRKLAKREARVHQKIARQRKQFHNESANRLVSKGAKHIFVEDLNTKGLTKRNKAKLDENGKYLPNGQSAKSGLTKSILDNGWGQFVDILTYKAVNAGVSVVKVNPKDTSQICSCCDAYVPKDLEVRLHQCSCGYTEDRDMNAAKNIKRVGLGIFPTIKRRKDGSVESFSNRKSTTIS